MSLSRFGATCDRRLCPRSSHATAPHRRRSDHARLTFDPEPCPALRQRRRPQPVQGVFLRPVRRAVAVRVILGRRPLDGAIAGACDSTRSAQRRPSREIRAVTLKRNVSLSGPPAHARFSDAARRSIGDVANAPGNHSERPDGARIARRASLTSARGPSALLERNTDGEDAGCTRAVAGCSVFRARAPPS